MTKALIVASVASMIKQFNMENIHLLLDLGVKVEVATNFDMPGTITNDLSESLQDELTSLGVRYYQIDFPRGMGTPVKNIECVKQLRQLQKENHYDLVHCHSPIGSALTRLAFTKEKIKIMYTAHGFQFFKGSSLLSWLVFYPIEWALSFNTNVIITINKEDEKIANQFGAEKVYRIPGVGINYSEIRSQYNNKEFYKKKVRTKLDIPIGAKVMVSVGELSDRKNHSLVINAMNILQNEKLYYIICGLGNEEKKLKNMVESYHLSDKVKFIGYSSEIVQYLYAADFSVFPSKREGLGLAGLEAMASGLPLISANLNGIKDYTEDKKTGFVLNKLDDPFECAKAIDSLLSLSDDRVSDISKRNILISKTYDKEKVKAITLNIYKDILLK